MKLLSFAILIALSSLVHAECDEERASFIESQEASFKSDHDLLKPSGYVAIAARELGLPVPVYEVGVDFNAFALSDRIVVSSEAAQLPAKQLMFVLAHELGHIKLKHSEDGLVQLDACKFVKFKLPAHVLHRHELEADSFASSYLKERGLFDADAVRSVLARQKRETDTHPSSSLRTDFLIH